jgi:hypothetical protein
MPFFELELECERIETIARVDDDHFEYILHRDTLPPVRVTVALVEPKPAAKGKGKRRKAA